MGINTRHQRKEQIKMMTRGECKTRVSVAENAKIAARPERKKSQPQRHGKFRFFTPTPRKILKNYLSPLWGLYSMCPFRAKNPHPADVLVCTGSLFCAHEPSV